MRSGEMSPLLLLLVVVWAAVVAATELHRPDSVQQNAAQRRGGGDVYTSSFLVRFHRSVDAAQAQHVAIRNGFESVGAVSEWFLSVLAFL